MCGTDDARMVLSPPFVLLLCEVIPRFYILLSLFQFRQFRKYLLIVPVNVNSTEKVLHKGKTANGSPFCTTISETSFRKEWVVCFPGRLTGWIDREFRYKRVRSKSVPKFLFKVTDLINGGLRPNGDCFGDIVYQCVSQIN